MRLDEQSALIVYDLTIDLQKSTTVLNQNYQQGLKYLAQWTLCYLFSWIKTKKETKGRYKGFLATCDHDITTGDEFYFSKITE